MYTSYQYNYFKSRYEGEQQQRRDDEVAVIKKIEKKTTKKSYLLKWSER